VAITKKHCLGCYDIDSTNIGLLQALFNKIELPKIFDLAGYSIPTPAAPVLTFRVTPLHFNEHSNRGRYAYDDI
jgi:hypothetical protein